MGQQNSYIYKWHKNIGFAILIHNLVVIIGVVFLVLFYKEDNLTWLILSVLLFTLSTASFIYSYNFGWNSPIYLDNEKAWTKIKGKIHVWEWNDITSCKVIAKKLGWRNPLSYRIEIATKDDNKNLVFEYSARREKLLLQLDLNENVKTILVNAFIDD